MGSKPRMNNREQAAKGVRAPSVGSHDSTSLPASRDMSGSSSAEVQLPIAHSQQGYAPSQSAWLLSSAHFGKSMSVVRVGVTLAVERAVRAARTTRVCR